MYIRATKTHTKGGKIAKSFRLSRSVRIGDKVRSWDGIRTRLRPWVRMTTTIRETNGRLIVNRQDVRPPAQLARIARAVGVEPHHHRRRTRRKPDPNTQT